MENIITKKDLTFKFFDEKWRMVSNYAEGTKDIYRRWYLERYGHLTEDNLKEFLEDKEYILDAGCGMARDSKFFAELNPKAKIVAVDQSSHAVRSAKKYLADCSNCQVVQNDITNMRLKEKFNFISCDQVIHHTPDPNQTLKHLMSYLGTNGIINFSVCRKKNKYRDFVDDKLMQHGRTMDPDELWKFSEAVTNFGRALYDLNIKNIEFEGVKYKNLQRFVHDKLFRCWYNAAIDFDLSVCSVYDWFSGNPRFDEKEVREQILVGLPLYKELSFYKDNATISCSLLKL